MSLLMGSSTTKHENGVSTNTERSTTNGIYVLITEEEDK